jgi:hypothetical protein
MTTLILLAAAILCCCVAQRFDEPPRLNSGDSNPRGTRARWSQAQRASDSVSFRVPRDDRTAHDSPSDTRDGRSHNSDDGHARDDGRNSAVAPAGTAARLQARNYDRNGRYIHSVARLDKPFVVATARGKQIFVYKRMGSGVRRAVRLMPGTTLPEGRSSAENMADESGDDRNPRMRRVVLVDVSISGATACGTDSAPEPCQRSCGASDAWASMQKIDQFYRSLSRGQNGYILDRSMIFSATIQAPTGTMNIPPMVEKVIGHKPGDSFVYLLPTNYHRDDLSVGAGIGEMPGNKVFMLTCIASAIAHELGHNWGMNHAGTTHNDQLVEYGDVASGEFLGQWLCLLTLFSSQ